MVKCWFHVTFISFQCFFGLYFFSNDPYNPSKKEVCRSQICKRPSRPPGCCTFPSSNRKNPSRADSVPFVSVRGMRRQHQPQVRVPSFETTSEQQFQGPSLLLLLLLLPTSNGQVEERAGCLGNNQNAKRAYFLPRAAQPCISNLSFLSFLSPPLHQVSKRGFLSICSNTAHYKV
jgi:hypothetical protein